MLPPLTHPHDLSRGTVILHQPLLPFSVLFIPKFNSLWKKRIQIIIRGKEYALNG